MKAKNLIRIILFSLVAIDCTVVSAQNCEEIFLNRLEQTYYRRKPHFIKQVRNAVISPKVVNLPDLQTLPEDSIILIGKVFFTKKTIKDIDNGKIDKSKYLCYLKPKSMVLNQAILTFNGNSFRVMRAGWTTEKVFDLDVVTNEELLVLIDSVKQNHPEIVFTTGFEGWDSVVFLVKNKEVTTLNLKTGIIEPVSENNTYVKEDLNTSLGVMTKPGKIVICY